MNALILPDAIYQTMLDHARHEFPHEACGLLRGRDGRVVDILPARNTAATPMRDYRVDATSLLQALAWEDEGDEMIAIYHSHPASAAYPSATDAANAFYPDSVYLIISLQNYDAPQVAGFYLRSQHILAGEKAAKLLRTMTLREVRPGLRSLYLPADSPRPDLIAPYIPEQTAVYLISEAQPGGQAPAIRIVSIHPVALHL